MFPRQYFADCQIHCLPSSKIDHYKKIKHLKVDFLQVYQVALVKHRIRKSPEDYIIGCDIYDDQDTYRFTFN